MTIFAIRAARGNKSRARRCQRFARVRARRDLVGLYTHVANKTLRLASSFDTAVILAVSSAAKDPG